MLAKKRTRKVLVVDDNKALRELFSTILNRGNFIVSEAENGKEALKKIIRNKPDMIILDIAMPQMDGFELSRLLRENSRTKDIPIIFCTTKHIEEVFPYKTEIDDYIKKPFSVEEFWKKVNNICAL